MGNAWRPDDTHTQPAALMIDMMATPCEQVEHLLSAAGPIAQALPGWQVRPQQRQLAQTIRRALKQRRHALTEGGTGTGKTNAYLIPAILHAKETGKPVVVATHTNALLDQLKHKDLPFLSSVIPFTWAVLKGRAQSLCEAKYSRGTEDPYVEEWRETTPDGDLSALALTAQRRRELTATREECTGARCSHADICWHLAAKARAHHADVVVVNHALLISALQADPGTVLPLFDALIIDEAHELAEVIRQACGVKVGGAYIRQLVKQVESYTGGVYEGILFEFDALLTTLQHARRADAQDGTALLDPDRDLTGAAEVHLVEVLEQLQKASREVQEAGEDHAEETEQRARANVLQGSLDRIAGELRSLRIGREGRVSWLSLGESSLHAQPVDVSSWLTERTKAPIVLSSATLATGVGDDAFRYVSETLGLRSLHQKVVGSPFDWSSQAWLYLPEEGMTEKLLGLGVKGRQQREELTREYVRVSVLHGHEVLRATRGRALWLFTSRAEMEMVAGALHVPHLMQGEMGQTEALEWLRSTGGVLLGVASLWQGIDLPGDVLSCVILQRIPFPPPSDHIHEARLRRAGGGPRAFAELSVPYAVTRLKQGFGRLIRTVTDRGLCVLMDPRLRTKEYGRQIVAALPPARRITRGDLRQVPWFLAGAGEAVEGPAEVAEGLRRLAAAGVPDGEHNAYVQRLASRLPLLPEGLWKASAWLCERYAEVLR